MEVKRRFANGVGLSVAYTFSKLIDNMSELFSYGNTSSLQLSSVPAPFGGMTLDRAVGFYDRPQRLVFTYNYELPFHKSQRGIAGHVLGGWQIVGLTTYESGVPYTVVNGQDVDGLGGAGGDRPNFNPNGQPRTRAVPDANSPTGYVNPDAGRAPIDPATARYIGISTNTSGVRRAPGTLGRNTERGPGLKNWNVNFVKTTNITERARLEFRSEFYNIFNTPMYGTVSVSPFAPAQTVQSIPATVFTSQPGQFMNVSSVDGGGRVIRWQLRLHF
jgi:hypothetical protein